MKEVMETTMVDRLESEICLTLDSTVGTRYFTQYRGTSPPAQATLRWQSNAMSLVTPYSKTAEANSPHFASHFALTKN